MSRITSFSVCRIAAVVILTISLGQPAQSQNAPQNPAGALNPAKQAQLDRILTEWHKSSSQIQVLNGEHRRYTYDYVFGVVKQAMGRFYYASPDRGRIDLAPNPDGTGTKIAKTHPLNSQAVQLTVQPDASERWVCDGVQVLQIDEKTKTVQQYPIPKEARGANIMDGPLPFLFGMKPAKAKERYNLVLVSEDAKWIDLLVRPRWKQDIANYQWARVRIERATMLPAAVQMIDPSGNKETVYTFPKIEKNPKPGVFKIIAWWKDKDPFKPDLKGYDIQLAEAAAVARPAQGPQIGPSALSPAQAAEKLIPAVVGLDYREAEKVLTLSGFKVKFQKGEAAVRRELVYRVQNQIPREKTAAKSGTLVWLTLYTPPVQQTGATASPAGTSPIQQAGGSLPALSKPAVPRVTGMHFRDAEKALRQAGYDVKFRRGAPARNVKEIYYTYNQIPAPGTELNKGQDVTLILFTKPKSTQPAAGN